MIVLFCLFANIFSLDLESIVKTVNSVPNGTWVAAYNPKFAAMSDSEFSQLCGVLSRSSTSSLSSSTQDLSNVDVDLPESYDAQSAWPQCPTIGRIYDQGHCGSCWAMCAFEVVQDRICIGTQGRLRPQLSGQQLTSCCSGSHACNGFVLKPSPHLILFNISVLLLFFFFILFFSFSSGWANTAFMYMQSHGLTTEECVPYMMGTCKHPGCSLWPTPKCSRNCTSNITQPDVCFFLSFSLFLSLSLLHSCYIY